MVGTRSSRFGLIGQLSLTMALVMSAVAAPTEVAAQGTPNGGKTVVGAWFNTVTPTLVAPFVGLGTFSADGGVTNISSVSLGSPLESPGYGQWIMTGAWHLRRHVPHDHGRRGRPPYSDVQGPRKPPDGRQR